MSAAVIPITSQGAHTLPIPKGPYILIRMTKTVDRVGSIHLPDSRVHDENLACPMGEVIAMGEAAYLPLDKFIGGPRCRVGDIVYIGAYVGSKFKSGPGNTADEYRLIFDDDVKAVVPSEAIVRRDM